MCTQCSNIFIKKLKREKKISWFPKEAPKINLTGLMANTLHVPDADLRERKQTFPFIMFHIHQYFFSCNTKKRKESQNLTIFYKQGRTPSNTVI